MAVSAHTSTASPTTPQAPFKLFSHGAATLVCQERHQDMKASTAKLSLKNELTDTTLRTVFVHTKFAILDP